MRKFIQVSVFVLTLTLTAHAGDMQCGVTNPPPSQLVNAVQEPATGGEISTGTAESLTIALDLLAALPSLL
jgi:hypothetical protein